MDVFLPTDNGTPLEYQLTLSLMYGVSFPYPEMKQSMESYRRCLYMLTGNLLEYQGMVDGYLVIDRDGDLMLVNVSNEHTIKKVQHLTATRERILKWQSTISQTPKQVNHRPVRWFDSHSFLATTASGFKLEAELKLGAVFPIPAPKQGFGCYVDCINLLMCDLSEFDGSVNGYWLTNDLDELKFCEQREYEVMPVTVADRATVEAWRAPFRPTTMHLTSELRTDIADPHVSADYYREWAERRFKTSFPRPCKDQKWISYYTCVKRLMGNLIGFDGSANGFWVTDQNGELVLHRDKPTDQPVDRKRIIQWQSTINPGSTSNADLATAKYVAASKPEAMAHVEPTGIQSEESAHDSTLDSVSPTDIVSGIDFTLETRTAQGFKGEAFLLLDAVFPEPAPEQTADCYVKCINLLMGDLTEFDGKVNGYWLIEDGDELKFELKRQNVIPVGIVADRNVVEEWRAPFRAVSTKLIPQLPTALAHSSISAVQYREVLERQFNASFPRPVKGQRWISYYTCVKQLMGPLIGFDGSANGFWVTELNGELVLNRDKPARKLISRKRVIEWQSTLKGADVYKPQQPTKPALHTPSALADFNRKVGTLLTPMLYRTKAKVEFGVEFPYPAWNQSLISYRSTLDQLLGDLADFHGYVGGYRVVKADKSIAFIDEESVATQKEELATREIVEEWRNRLMTAIASNSESKGDVAYREMGGDMKEPNVEPTKTVWDGKPVLAEGMSASEYRIALNAATGAEFPINAIGQSIESYYACVNALLDDLTDYDDKSEGLSGQFAGYYLLNGFDVAPFLKKLQFSQTREVSGYRGVLATKEEILEWQSTVRSRNSRKSPYQALYGSKGGAVPNEVQASVVVPLRPKQPKQDATTAEWQAMLDQCPPELLRAKFEELAPIQLNRVREAQTIMAKAQELDALIEVFIDWWMNHHEDAHYFNLAMKASPTLGNAMQQAIFK